MATTSAAHPRHHPLVRAAGIDVALIAFGLGALVLTFLTGQGEPRWHNLVFAPLVMLLAAFAARLVLAEIREFRARGADSGHPLESLAALGVALVAMVVVVPLLLIMPFVFFSGMV